MSNKNNPEEKQPNDYQRDAGKRIKAWGWDGDMDRLIESTGEHPIMYRALGTEPRTAHPYNLYGDIGIQPTALRDTLHNNLDVVQRIADKMVEKKINRMLGTGLGTSQFVAQTASGAFWRYAGIEAADVDSLEFISTDRVYDMASTGFFAYSGSGSTVDSNRAAQKARAMGAYTLAFTSVAGSPITTNCEDAIICAGGFDTGGSDTFHYTTRLGASVLLAIALGERLQPNKLDYKVLRARLLELPDKFAAMFDAVDARCHSLAKRYKHIRANLIVGSGANLGAAEEMALKFDEMCHIPTKAMCPARHIHGALGLTDENILTILLAPKSGTYKELTDIARATQILKSPSIAIVSENDNEIANLVDDVIRLPEEDDILFTLLAILPSQLLPYWCAVEAGDINPDCQRSNITKYARVWRMLFPPGTH